MSASRMINQHYEGQGRPCLKQSAGFNPVPHSCVSSICSCSWFVYYVTCNFYSHFFFIVLYLCLSEFGVLIGAWYKLFIGNTYIQYTYLIAVIFQGNCFVTIFIARPLSSPPPTDNHRTQNTGLWIFHRLSLWIAITVVMFVLKWIGRTKHFVPQWLSIGLGLVGSHFGSYCFTWAICSNTNVTTKIYAWSESELIIYNYEGHRWIHQSTLDTTILSLTVEFDYSTIEHDFFSRSYTTSMFTFSSLCFL